MTRWVTDDLAGRLIERDGLDTQGGKWHLLKMPILDEHGESLWPEMYSLQEIQGIRETLGEKIFPGALHAGSCRSRGTPICRSAF
jgi:hypothetical protein